jgi:hypothetical protein
MFDFKKKKQLSENECKELRRQKDHDFWMNEIQYLMFKDHQECLTIRGRDIECCWVDNHGSAQWIKDKSGNINPNKAYSDNCDYMIRTRSGKEFSIMYEDWLKARFEDPNYKCVK